MSQPVSLQEDFSLGATTDVPRHQLARGKVYQMTDWIPELDGAPAAKRGGWNRAWAALSTTGTHAAAVGFGAFAAGSQIVGVDSGGNLSRMTYSASTVTGVTGLGIVPAHPPTFYRDNLFFCDINGSAAPDRYDGATVTAVAGSPPAGSVSCVYKDHLVLARSSANKNRVWFSSAGDYGTWDTAADGQWLDTTYPVQALGALKNMILVFSEGATERIRGDVIPGVVGSDMVKEPLFQNGCSDPASVAVTDDFVVFANSSGIFLTDGVGLADLTEQAGMGQYWRSQMSGYASTWTIAAAVQRGWYVFSVMDGSTFKHAGMLDVKRRRFVKLTNLAATMLVASPTGILDTPPKLVFSERAALRVSDATTMWTPSATYKNDGDGTAVTPVIELPHYMGKPGKKRWKNLYVKHHMTDAASDNPTLTIAYSTDLASSSYTSLSPVLAETSGVTRIRLPIGVMSEGVSLKITQANASAVTQLYGIEADMQAVEAGRL